MFRECLARDNFAKESRDNFAKKSRHNNKELVTCPFREAVHVLAVSEGLVRELDILVGGGVHGGNRDTLVDQDGSVLDHQTWLDNTVLAQTLQGGGAYSGRIIV